MNNNSASKQTPIFIVRYLPQFHRIKENDEWWGEGFTEWTAVRNATPLFQGHDQPKAPYHNNYYDLSLKTTMEWQAKLGKEYGIGCFAFYHYWFDKGKRILEKPAENLLRWQDVDMPFCFTWANETWARTWSKYRGANTWGNLYETTDNAQDNGILLEQKYGEQKDWVEHFNYLLPFFKDERYLKRAGCPVFIIYKPEYLHCWPDMRDCWEKEARKAGLPGLYVIGEAMTQGLVLDSDYDARLLREPNCSWQKLQIEWLPSGTRFYNRHDYWEKILSGKWHEGQYNMPTYICLADSFDNTPRNGAAGTIMQGGTPEELRKNIGDALNISGAFGHEYIFYNAWNEWGEGMFLEPDEKYGYGKLEAVRDALKSYKATLIKSDIEHSKSDNTPLYVLERSKDKYFAMSKAFDRWLLNIEQGKSIFEYLKRQGLNKIAVYGVGYLGKHLITELQKSSIEVAYIIDRNIYAKERTCPTYQLSSDLPLVDAIIVTPTGEYATIRRKILSCVNYKVVSLEHILFEM